MSRADYLDEQWDLAEEGKIWITDSSYIEIGLELANGKSVVIAVSPAKASEIANKLTAIAVKRGGNI